MNWEKSQAQILQNAFNQQLLRILGERIARREIEYLNPFLFIAQKGQKVISVCLKDGRITEKEPSHA